MPKVDLKDVRIAISPAHNKVYFCTTNPDNSIKEKVECTDLFMASVIDFWKGTEQRFDDADSDKSYLISVTQIN